MFRSIALLVCASPCFAQSPADLFNRPPEDVDQALRARITQFYQAHVDGKPRLAEPLVAEDTKDFFYNGNKPKYLSFEIKRIDYSDNFTRAKAMVLCEQFVMIPGFTDKPIKVPTPSRWKLVDGQWYWYVDQDELRMTPFGKMTAGPNPPPNGPAGLPAIPTAKDMEFIFQQVKADKAAVTLKKEEPEEVTITSTAKGPMTVTVAVVPPGVDAKLDRANIGPGEKAILTLRAGANASPGVVSLRVEQTNHMIPITVGIQ
jgi:hypothetical protein